MVDLYVLKDMVMDTLKIEILKLKISKLNSMVVIVRLLKDFWVTANKTTVLPLKVKLSSKVQLRKW